MGTFKISLEQYRGTSYDIGYRQGKQIDQFLLDMRSNILNVEAADLDEIQKVYSSNAPHLLEELAGLADAMDISFDEAARFSGYGALQIQGMGCSSVVNQHILVRNYDFSPEIYDARLVFVQPKEGYASVGHSLHVMGRTEGVNEKGLAIALHFVNNNRQRGLAGTSVIRIVLDQCKDTNEAVAMIKQLPHSWCYNFSIGDSKGNTAVVEQSPNDIKVRKDNDVLFCTNHFQNESMIELNRENNVITRSQERLNYLHKSHLESMSTQEVFDTFRDARTPLYNENYREFFGTLHTFAYLFNKHKVLTAIPGGDVLEFDFNEWVRGKNINQKELIGNLNTD